MPGRNNSQSPTPSGSFRSYTGSGSVGPNAALDRQASTLASLGQSAPNPYDQFNRPGVPNGAVDDDEILPNGFDHRENGRAIPTQWAQESAEPNGAPQAAQKGLPRMPYDPEDTYDDVGSITPTPSSTDSDSTTELAKRNNFSYDIQDIYDDAFSGEGLDDSGRFGGSPRQREDPGGYPAPSSRQRLDPGDIPPRPQEPLQRRTSKKPAPPPPSFATTGAEDETDQLYDDTILRDDPGRQEVFTESAIYDDLDNFGRGGSKISRSAHMEEEEKEGMPHPHEVIRQFEEYLEVMSPLEEAEEDKLRKETIEKKWMILFQQNDREPVYSLRHYLDNLKLHCGANRKRMSIRKMTKQGIPPLSSLLRKLKLDLKMSGKGFVIQFNNDANKGLGLLLQVLKEIQEDHKVLQQNAKKNKYGMDMKQNLTDEYDCLICIKLAIKAEEGVTKLLSYPGSLDSIITALISTFVKIRVITLEILHITCQNRHGFPRVDDAFTHLRVVQTEAVRFKQLLSMLSSTTNIQFRVASVKMFNTMWQCITSAERKVHFQQELEIAGFEPDDFDRYGLAGNGPEFDMFQKELDLWRKNCIRINSTQEKMVDLENRNDWLREEINRLQDSVKNLEKQLRNSEQTAKEFEKKSTGYRENAAELQDTVAKLQRLYEEKTGEALDDSQDLANRALDMYETVRGNRFGTTKSLMSQKSLPEPPQTPLPPLPPPANVLDSKTVRLKLYHQVRLPILNWTPMTFDEKKRSLFEKMDDEAKLREVNFAQFEQQFKLQVKEESEQTKAKRARLFSLPDDMITFVEANRAKMMLITKKRTGMTGRQIALAIDQCKIHGTGDAEEDLMHPPLPGEYAQLLLPFVPTKEEMRSLAKHSNDYDKMGEAEQFIFQLTRIDRCGSKLAVMAFMDYFQELVEMLVPQIVNVTQASQSMVNCEKLKEVFELILAFGNFLNSSKRGYAMGFKLESLAKLEEVKSTDKSHTLLQFLVGVIDRQYPHLNNFYEELIVEVQKGVSYQSMNLDIIGLRKGLDMVKFERGKQPNNEIINDFHNNAAELVASAAEQFHQMEQVYKRMCHMFGEDYKSVEPYAIFRMLHEFIEAFKEAQNPHRSIKAYTRPPVVSPASPLSPQSPKKTAYGFQGVPASSETPSPLSPVLSAQAKTLSEEVAKAANDPNFFRKRSDKKKDAPAAPPVDVPDGISLSSTATIDKKVGEKIKIFEQKIKNKETESQPAVLSPRVTEDAVYDDVLTPGAENDFYDDTVNPGTAENEYYDDGFSGVGREENDYYDEADSGNRHDAPMKAENEYYDDATSPYRRADNRDYDDGRSQPARPENEYYDDGRSHPERAENEYYDDGNAAGPTEVYEEPDRQDFQPGTYPDIPNPPAESQHNGARPKEQAPSKYGRKLPRTPFEEDPQRRKSGSKAPITRKISRKEGKRLTIPSGEYSQIQDFDDYDDTGGPESADIKDALTAFDGIWPEGSVNDTDDDTESTHF